MVQGFQNQAKISQAILSQSQMQTSKLEEIKKISYSGFNNLSKKMDSSIALQGSMNTMLKAQWALQQSLPALQGSGANLNSQGSISSLIQSAFGDSDTTKILGNMIDTGLSTGSKTKAVSAGIGTAASLFVGSFCPAAAPIVASVGTKAAEGLIRGVKKVFNWFGGGSVDGFEYYALDDSSSLTASSSDDTSINSSFQETNYRVLFTAYQDADEDDEELREALMKMIFQEDKRRVLYAAVQLASFKRPYPVFPKNLEDLVLDAKNATELREAILPLAVYCGVSPEALTFAAQYIY